METGTESKVQKILHALPIHYLPPWPNFQNLAHTFKAFSHLIPCLRIWPIQFNQFCCCEIGLDFLFNSHLIDFLLKTQLQADKIITQLSQKLEQSVKSRKCCMYDMPTNNIFQNQTKTTFMVFSHQISFTLNMAFTI